jgi:hypothetical protein
LLCSWIWSSACGGCLLASSVKFLHSSLCPACCFCRDESKGRACTAVGRTADAVMVHSL